MKNKGRLILIPVLLGGDSILRDLPAYNLEIVLSIRTFIVEEEKHAFRFLKKCGYPFAASQPRLLLLNEHSRDITAEYYFEDIYNGCDTGLLSDAGVPCVADPGSTLVSLAHDHGIKVLPLTGPSSVILALMASGLNGQNFVFHGYLPVNKKMRSDRLKVIERLSRENRQTQVFIETPYRNNQLLSDILLSCKNTTLLCVAANLTLENEFIRTMEIGSWKSKIPDLNKQPAVFLLLAS